jgi:hypothetical protein
MVDGVRAAWSFFHPGAAHCAAESEPVIGRLISRGIRLATLPLDASSALIDVMSGGSGSKASRTGSPINPLRAMEKARDAVAEAIQRGDEEGVG